MFFTVYRRTRETGSVPSCRTRHRAHGTTASTVRLRYLTFDFSLIIIIIVRYDSRKIPSGQNMSRLRARQILYNIGGRSTEPRCEQSRRSSGSSGERSVRMTTDATAVPAADADASTGAGEQTSNRRPVWRLDDALPAAVRRVDRRHRIRRPVVERLQLYVMKRFAATAVVVRVVFAAVVHGTGRVRRRTGNAVPVSPAPRPCTRARAYGRVVGRRRGASTPAVHRRHGAHRKAGHGPMRRDHVTFQSDGSLCSL